MYRPHRGTLADSLKESVTVETIDDLHDLLGVKDGRLTVEYYTFDERLGQETYMVRVNLEIQGFLTDIEKGNFFNDV